MQTQTNPLTWHTIQRGVSPSQHTNSNASVLYAGKGIAAGVSGGRNTFTVPLNGKFNGCTYFNAFPASYWQHWAKQSVVKLNIELTTPALIEVWKSNYKGVHDRVHTAANTASLELELPLSNFEDGGLYWVDVTATAATEITRFEWALPKLAVDPGTLSIGITTFNRAHDCCKQLEVISSNTELVSRLDTLYVVDQGTDLVSNQPGFSAIAETLGTKLRVIRQANMGGSGGFSRAMFETLAAGQSDYVMLLDDDAISEPESIIRALELADYAAAAGNPILVGGAMFRAEQPAVMYTQGETIDFNTALFKPVTGLGYDTDFSVSPLAQTPKLHKRYDSLYNGWWMTLIPTQIIHKIGLGLPYFIKWDDVEYGVRANAHGYPTVTMPGVAVWHPNWDDKFVWKSWQGYFSERNMTLTMLSVLPEPGKIPWRAFMVDVGMLLSLQYSSVALRIAARKAAIAGFDALPSELSTILGKVNKLRTRFTDAKALSVTELPKVEPVAERNVPQKTGQLEIGGFSDYLLAARAAWHQFVVPPRKRATHVAESLIPAHDALWWRFSKLDSALVAPVDAGGKYTLLVRSRKLSWQLLRQSWASTRYLKRHWQRLHRDAIPAHKRVSSVESWRKIFS